MSEENECSHPVIKLDGSMGVGDRALLSIITTDTVEGEKTETFEFPIALINLSVLANAMHYNFISGYKITRRSQSEVV